MNQPQPQKAAQGAPRSRPGAMTMAMQAVQVRQSGPKVLRIGLIQGGKIVEERIIRRRETVSVGTSEKNHFIIQAPNLPSRFDLFQLVGADYILNFTADMKGRVGLAGGVRDLDDLRSTGAARNAGNYWQVKLNDTSRGKIVIGDVTLLFQFVVQPPVQPRPQLPAAVVGGFVASIDWLFTSFVVSTFMIVFGFIVYLENADWPLEEGIAAVPESVARLIFDEPEPPPVIPEEAATEEEPTKEEEGEEEQTKATPAPAKKAGGPDRARDQGMNAEERSRMVEQSIAAVNQLLGAAGGDGQFADLLRGGSPSDSLEDVLAQVQATRPGTSSASALRTRSGGGSSGQEGGLGSLRAAGGEGTGTRQEGEQVIERVIRGRINLEEGGDIGGAGEFDQQIVVNTIRSRLRAIQRCYETELRNNPSLAGKVTVQFTIQESGSVTGARATENTSGSAGLSDCVVSTVSRFRFNPGPTGGSVSFSYPFVFAPQN